MTLSDSDLTDKGLAPTRGGKVLVVADPTEDAVGFYQSLGVRQDGDHRAMFTTDL